MSQFHPEYKIFLIIKMLLFFFPKTIVNAAKTSVVMFSKVEGKARNVDYIFSCKLRLLERLII